jgi:cytochrome b561
MSSEIRHFTRAARTLHWLMAILIMSMLFIGVGMVASVSERHDLLLRIHKPLGIAILILAIVRIVVRVRNPPPPLPGDLPALQKLVALASHWLLYILMVAMPLIGWAMLSAGGYPVMLSDTLRLPPIFPVSPTAFAVLRHMHAWFAAALLLTCLAHMGAALYHGLIRRDGVFSSMAHGERVPELGEELGLIEEPLDDPDESLLR